MDERTLLICSGDRQRLLLDLNALGYRIRALPTQGDTFEAHRRIDGLEASLGEVNSQQRYCRTRSFEHALEETLSHRRPVLISGETGTGKAVLARAVCEHSVGAARFPMIHCQALHRAAADGRCIQCIEERLYAMVRSNPGLLLVDEVGALGPECQRAMLDILTDIDSTNTRIVVTSRRSIDMLIDQGTLLPAFVDKLELAHVRLPPLRDHPADIPLLAEWFVAEANIELAASAEGLAPAAIREAVGHDWPGNAQELRDTVFRAVLRQSNGWIEKLPFERKELSPTLAGLIRHTLPKGAEPLALMQQFERELLQALNEIHSGNKSRIARALGMSRNTLKSRLRAYNL
ncbi:MAG: sigma 54-interacting transcriptional regulator [Gammaproteobacteria bacterium]|nr:sigma 54-interacting transcriptional regulator [Gammaproteobacteria bacterium]